MAYYAISGDTRERIEVENKAQVRAMIPTVYQTTVTAAYGTISVPVNSDILCVQNCDATNSNDAVTSWARTSHNTLYYNKSGSSPTKIQVVYVGVSNG